MKSRYLKFMDTLAPNTIRGYKQAIKKYEELYGMTIDELVEEALNEQTERIPPHLLKVIDRIEDFQNYLIGLGLMYGTILTLSSKIKSIYTKNRVVIPYITPLNAKKIKRREYIEYKDVLTKDELRCALMHMRLPSQARAYAMISGGLSNEECEHLTTRAFIDELYKYHQCDDDIEALKWLADENNPLIWVTKIIRQKTKKPYYAIIGAEAVNVIASAKLYEMKLPKNDGKIPDKLLDTNKNSFSRTCRIVNDKCNLGLVAEESKLKAHNLRRFHATYIRGSVLSYEENYILTYQEIDEMQGRGKTGTQDTYIKTNPIRQKVLYAKVMNNVSLYHKYDYEIVDDDVLVYVKDVIRENDKLISDIKKLKKALDKKKKASARVEALKKEMGEEEFYAMISNILKPS